MKNLQFRTPYEVRMKVKDLVESAENMRKKGYVAPDAFYKLLNGLYALDAMCDRKEREFWDDTARPAQEKSA